MNIIKKTFVLLTVLISFNGLSQQFSQFTQYTNNIFIINPAASGINNKLNVAMGYRNQWTSFQNNPSAFYVGGNYTLNKDITRSYLDHSIRVSNSDLFKRHESEGKNKHVVGAYVIGNNFLPVSNMSVSGLYAFHLAVDEFHVSLGAALSFNQFKTNLADISFFQGNDSQYESFLSKKSKTSFADMNLGIMAYSHNMYFGYSVVGLVPNQLKFDAQGLSAKINTHHYVTLGTKQKLSSKIDLNPSILIKTLKNVPTSFDVNVMAIYDDSYRLGVSYRHDDAIAVMGGLTFNHHYTISYSYDITTSTLKQFSKGTHEIVLLAKF